MKRINQNMQNLLYTINISLCLGVMLFVVILPGCKKDKTERIPVVTISSLSKNLLNIGDTLLINGSNFNAIPEKNLVSVASFAFPVVKASATQLWVVVPQGAQSGQLSIGFSQGQSTSFDQLITIVGSLQPFISSISPAKVYEGDTVVVTGGNFGIPYNSNAISFGGVKATIFNATEHELKVIVPDLAQTGSVQVTTRGSISQPYPFSINKVSPTEDGHIYWIMPIYAFSDEFFTDVISGAIFNRGADTNTGTTQSSTIYALNKPYFPMSVDEIFYPEIPNHDNIIVNDSKGIAYYITGSAIPFPAEYHLMKADFSNTSVAPVSIWSKNFEEPGSYTDFYPDPNSSPVQVKYAPLQQLSMDGDVIYIKIGLSDDYYTGDVSGTLLLKKDVFGDPQAYRPQFAQNYIFYSKLGAQSIYSYSADVITEIRYMTRGSKNSLAVPLELSPGEKITTTIADKTHGDELLIITLLNGNTSIYKFDAQTKKLTKLYHKSNWLDARPSNSTGGDSNSGYLWLGKHIYYSHTKNQLYSALYRLNDDGTSSKPYTVYGKIEPSTSVKAGTNFSFFTGKK